MNMTRNQGLVFFSALVIIFCPCSYAANCSWCVTPELGPAVRVFDPSPAVWPYTFRQVWGWTVAAADIDRDGKIDMIAGSTSSGAFVVLRGRA
jgi:hypothetical protein